MYRPYECVNLSCLYYVSISSHLGVESSVLALLQQFSQSDIRGMLLHFWCHVNT
jgi:hypothetical protein